MWEMGNKTDDIVGIGSTDQMDVDQGDSSSRILKTDNTEWIQIAHGASISDDEGHNHTWAPMSKYNAVGKQNDQDDPWAMEADESRG